jgi:hypothetical protein
MSMLESLRIRGFPSGGQLDAAADVNTTQNAHSRFAYAFYATDTTYLCNSVSIAAQPVILDAG